VDLGGFACALVADSVSGVRTVESGPAQWPRHAGAADFVDGAVRLDDGLCLVIDPERFLFEQDRQQLAEALAGAHDARG
jgi:purine-binding chemotaxis protein CheW